MLILNNSDIKYRIPSKSHSFAVAVLSLTQIINWGTTFHLVPIVAPHLARDFGIPISTSLYGVSLFLLTGAIASPVAGVWFKDIKLKILLIVGSIIISSGLALLIFANTTLVYLIIWTIIGLAVPLSLGQTTFVALATITGSEFRRKLSVLLAFSSLSAAIFWPLTSFLLNYIGIKFLYLVYSLGNMMISIPCYLMISFPSRESEGVDFDQSNRFARDTCSKGELLPILNLATAVSLINFINIGLLSNLIIIINILGYSSDTIAFTGMAISIGQFCSRLSDLLVGRKIDVIMLGLFAYMSVILSLIIIYIASPAEYGLFLFAIFFGWGAGAATIVRVSAPLIIFGIGRYQYILGILGLCQNIITAAAPAVFAYVLGRFQVGSILLVTCAITGCSIVLLIQLKQFISRTNKIV